jgi:cysteine synthase
VLSGRKPGAHRIQGMGAGFVPDILDRSVIDVVITISSQTAFDTARALACYEGILGGISSGPRSQPTWRLASTDAWRGRISSSCCAILCGTLTCRRRCLRDIEIALPSPT